jgi:hypothetical protein
VGTGRRNAPPQGVVWNNHSRIAAGCGNKSPDGRGRGNEQGAEGAFGVVPRRAASPQRLRASRLNKGTNAHFSAPAPWRAWIVPRAPVPLAVWLTPGHAKAALLRRQEPAGARRAGALVSLAGRWGTGCHFGTSVQPSKNFKREGLQRQGLTLCDRKLAQKLIRGIFSRPRKNRDALPCGCKRGCLPWSLRDWPGIAIPGHPHADAYNPARAALGGCRALAARPCASRGLPARLFLRAAHFR